MRVQLSAFLIASSLIGGVSQAAEPSDPFSSLFEPKPFTLNIDAKDYHEAISKQGFEVVWKERSLYRNIIVIENEKIRCLVFSVKGSLQSCLLRENPKKIAFEYLQTISTLMSAKKPSSSLIIGFGAGTLPTFMQDKFPLSHLTAVELDPAVVKVARTHFGFNEGANTKIHIGDARVFLRQKEPISCGDGDGFDVIVLDAMDKSYIPEHLASIEFFKLVESHLNLGGVVIANVFQNERVRPYEEATWRAAFGEVSVIDLPGGNSIFVAGPGREALVGKQPMFKRVADRPGSEDRILTDRYSPINLLLGS